MTIWKFHIQVTDLQWIEMPKDARILTCQVQRGQICLWAMVDPAAPGEKRGVRVFGTGHPLPAEYCSIIAASRGSGILGFLNFPPPAEYVGSVQLHEGELVFHVFLEAAE